MHPSGFSRTEIDPKVRQYPICIGYIFSYDTEMILLHWEGKANDTSDRVGLNLEF